jgi:hypothetical protein
MTNRWPLAFSRQRSPQAALHVEGTLSHDDHKQSRQELFGHTVASYTRRLLLAPSLA